MVLQARQSPEMAAVERHLQRMRWLIACADAFAPPGRPVSCSRPHGSPPDAQAQPLRAANFAGETPPNDGDTTASLCDACCAALEAPRLDQIVWDETSTIAVRATDRAIAERPPGAASFQTLSKEALLEEAGCTLSIGRALWDALTPLEQRAVVLHEIAHHACGHVELARAAQQTLASLAAVSALTWRRQPTPDKGAHHRARRALALILAHLAGREAVRLMQAYAAFEARAERDADAIAAMICGPDAVRSALAQARTSANATAQRSHWDAGSAELVPPHARERSTQRFEPLYRARMAQLASLAQRDDVRTTAA
ncbi:MAG: M48 family metalloprotease [Pseudomonadota bacterium]